MELTKVFDPGAILLDLVGFDRDHAILELLKLLEERGHVRAEHRDDVLLDLLKREASGSTAIGLGVALPHVRTDHVTEMRGAIGLSADGLDFAAPDGKSVRAVFLFLSPTWAEREHLRLLAEVGKLAQNVEFVERLLSAREVADVRELLGRARSYMT